MKPCGCRKNKRLWAQIVSLGPGSGFYARLPGCRQQNVASSQKRPACMLLIRGQNKASSQKRDNTHALDPWKLPAALQADKAWKNLRKNGSGRNPKRSNDIGRRVQSAEPRSTRVQILRGGPWLPPEDCGFKEKCQNFGSREKTLKVAMSEKLRNGPGEARTV